MRNTRWKDFFTVFGLTFVFALIGSIGSMDSKEIYESLQMPWFAPKSSVFSIVWTILFILMATATFIIKEKAISSVYKKDALSTYWLQLILNAVWPFIFFKYEMRFFAFLWIIVLCVIVYLNMVKYFKLNKMAGVLMVPYFLWLIYAGILNYSIWLLNK